MDIIEFNGKSPRIHLSAYLDPKATIIGDVEIGEGTSIWPGAVIRGDAGKVMIGRWTNVQENVVIHGRKTVIGDYVTICHGAIIHGATIENNVLISHGAIVLDNTVIRSDSIIDAGSLIPENHEIPRGVIVHGIPGKPVRNATEDEIKYIRFSAESYIERTKRLRR